MDFVSPDPNFVPQDRQDISGARVLDGEDQGITPSRTQQSH